MKSKKYIVPIMLLVLIMTGCKNNQGVNSSEPLSRTEFLMDTVMTVRIYDNKKEKTLDKVFNRLEEIESKMSATIESSDVNKINQNAGIEPVTVHPDTYFVIEKAIYYAEISDGAYDPTIAPLVDLWGVKSGETERDEIPTDKEIEKIKPLVDYKNLQLLENNKIFLKEKHTKINLGSIVKGYAADEVRRILLENDVNIAMIDLGGNIFAHGVKADNSSWKIGIQNPLEYTGNFLGILQVKDKSIVTSGDYERYFVYNDKKYHHILDTTTGYPVDNEIMGVSILSEKSIDGDCLSTTLFALGLDKGMELVNSIEGAEAIFIAKDKTIYLSEGIKDSFILSNVNAGFTVRDY